MNLHHHQINQKEKVKLVKIKKIKNKKEKTLTQ